MLLLAMFTTMTAWADDTVTLGGHTFNVLPDGSYEIANAEDLANLADYVNSGVTYSDCTGLTFSLTNDFTYSGSPIGYFKAGGETRYFNGTFNGQGHTLTLDMTANCDGYTLFPRTYKGTFTRLHVTGTINAGKYIFIGGIFGDITGTSTVSSCRSSVTIISTCTYTAVKIGGFAGMVRSVENAPTFENCLFDGTLQYQGSNGQKSYWSGFVGDNEMNTTLFTHCLQAGTTNTTGTNLVENFASYYHETNNPDRYAPTISSCYYTNRFGNSEQGTDATSMSLSELQSALGSRWEIVTEGGVQKVVPVMTQVNLDNAVITGVDPLYAYTGSNISITPIVSLDNTPLSSSFYDISYSPSVPRAVGDYTLTVTGKGLYTGSKSINFRVLEPIAYRYYDTEAGEYKNGSVLDFIPVTNELTNWENGKWYVVNNDVTITHRINPTGMSFDGTTAHLILCDGKTLTANEGLAVGNWTLNIYDQTEGTGALHATATSDFAAAIGGDNQNGGGGSINIHGGIIVAQSTYCAPGIGGNNNTVTIYNGNITATGGKDGPGIGGGGNQSPCTTVIYDGIINATGGQNAAGIGGAEFRDGGIITIHGGTITAEGHTGIGGGYYGAGGTITIHGGNITATGRAHGAGIGGGASGNNIDDKGNSGVITITGGVILATGGETAAGIGGGCEGNVIENGITITGGQITAIGGDKDEEHDYDYYPDAIGRGCNGQYYFNGGTPSFSWTNADDYIITNRMGGSETNQYDVILRKKFVFDDNGTITIATRNNMPGHKLCPAIDLADNADNTDVIATTQDLCNGSKTIAVQLLDRTLYKDGAWNTLCLPFDVTIADSPLKGDNVVAKVLNTAESSLDSNGKLTLKFSDAPATIPAGSPFIIKWDNTGVNLVSPVFAGVTVNNADTSVGFGDGNASFVGTYSPFDITNANKGYILLLTGGGKLGYSNVARTLGSCRAYFNTNGANAAREFVIDFGDETTGIQTIDHSPLTIDHSNGAVYDLQGRKVANPTKGLYIVNGRKFIK